MFNIFGKKKNNNKKTKDMFSVGNSSFVNGKKSDKELKSISVTSNLSKADIENLIYLSKYFFDSDKNNLNSDSENLGKCKEEVRKFIENSCSKENTSSINEERFNSLMNNIPKVNKKLYNAIVNGSENFIFYLGSEGYVSVFDKLSKENVDSDESVKNFVDSLSKEMIINNNFIKYSESKLCQEPVYFITFIFATNLHKIIFNDSNKDNFSAVIDMIYAQNKSVKSNLNFSYKQTTEYKDFIKEISIKKDILVEESKSKKLKKKI